MTKQKIINTEALNELYTQLELIEYRSAVLNSKSRNILIDGMYYDEKEINELKDSKCIYLSIEYLDSGISEIIEITEQGAISLDNNTNEYSPMYSEDLMDIAKVADILVAWWKNLPETKL